MTNIAFIHGRFPAGGAERVTIDIARYLHQFKGEYNISVYTSRINESPELESICQYLTIKTLPKQLFDVRRSRKIIEFVQKDNIDIVVLVSKSTRGIQSLRDLGCKVVYANHGEPFWQRYAIVHRRQNGVLKRILWKLFNRRRFADGTKAMEMAISRTLNDYNNSDAYVVLCKSYAEEIIAKAGILEERPHICHIENCELPVADPNLNKEKIILFCGRFEHWSKRIDRLLRIWQKVQHQLPDWKLQLLGDGPAFAQMQELAKDLGLERVCFEGKRANVADYYSKASVIALTSQTEGWPLALTEGRSHGCIPIAFDCTAGIKEIISMPGSNGYIIPNFDENEYAKALLQIATLTPEEELRIRKQAIETSLQFAPEKIFPKWKKLIDSLANQNSL